MVLPNALAVPIMLSSVNVALPDIASDLNLSAVAVSWVPTVFLMASAMFVLIFGRVADMYGRKKVFLIGAVTVIASSFMASMAGDSSQLLVARFLQGFGAAMLYATQMALISSVFPPQARGRAIGWVISLIYVGLAVGPLLGGVITEYFGWRPTFYLQIPLAFAVLYIGLFKVKKNGLLKNGVVLMLLEQDCMQEVSHSSA
jgi:MFS family permease